MRNTDETRTLSLRREAREEPNVDDVRPVAGGSSSAAARTVLPDEIELPSGWQPEGLAKGPGATFFSGSLANGDVLAVDAVTGRQRVVVDAPAGRVAAGLKQDRSGRLWVAGGGAGEAYVYGADGNPLYTFSLGSPGSTFVNDVVLTRRAAWFTDSFAGVLYEVPVIDDDAVGTPVTITLSGDYHQSQGFNLNGIAATPDGRWLISVQTNTGTLYRIDPHTGAATAIDLGGAAVVWGDGMLVDGHRLYVVQNFLNRICVIDLDRRNYTSGRVVAELTSPRFDIPTAVVRIGDRLYVANARLSTPPTETTPYEIVTVRLNAGEGHGDPPIGPDDLGGVQRKVGPRRGGLRQGGSRATP